MLRLIIALASTILLQPAMGEEGLPWHSEDPPPCFRCADNGWISLQDSKGDPFADEDACCRFVTDGGILRLLTIPRSSPLRSTSPNEPVGPACHTRGPTAARSPGP